MWSAPPSWILLGGTWVPIGINGWCDATFGTTWTWLGCGLTETCSCWRSSADEEMPVPPAGGAEKSSWKQRVAPGCSRGRTFEK